MPRVIHQRCMLEGHAGRPQPWLDGQHCLVLMLVSSSHVARCRRCLNRAIDIVPILGRLLLHASKPLRVVSCCHERLRLEHRHLFWALRSTAHWIEDTIVLVSLVSLSHWPCCYAHMARAKHLGLSTETLCMGLIPALRRSVDGVAGNDAL